MASRTFPIVDEAGLFVGTAQGFDTAILPGQILPPMGSVDAELPDVPEGHRAYWDGSPPWRIEASPPPAPDPEPAPITAAQAMAIIDAGADAIVRETIGDRGDEYRQAEADAIAFAASGYQGNAPISISVWMQASGMSAQAATDDILTQSAAWRAALMQLRAARLQSKAVAMSGDVDGALAAWRQFDTQIRVALGINSTAVQS